MNLLDELLDPGVDDELTAELDGQEKKIGIIVLNTVEIVINHIHTKIK